MSDAERFAPSWLSRHVDELLCWIQGIIPRSIELHSEQLKRMLELSHLQMHRARVMFRSLNSQLVKRPLSNCQVIIA